MESGRRRSAVGLGPIVERDGTGLQLAGFGGFYPIHITYPTTESPIGLH